MLKLVDSGVREEELNGGIYYHHTCFVDGEAK
jgi:hypothetical protein